jgi:integrase
MLMTINSNGSIEKYKKKKVIRNKNGERTVKEINAWRVRYRYENNNGELHQASKSGFTEHHLAKDFLTSVSYEVKEDLYLHKTDVNLSEVADLWLIDYKTTRVRPNTISWHENNLKHIKPYMGNKSVQDVSSEVIRKFLNYILDTKSLCPTTVSNVNRTLGQILDYAIEKKYITSNPCRDKKNLTLLKNIHEENDFESKVISQNEILKIIDCCKDDQMSVPIALAGLMGLRKGEIRGLKWNNIDFVNKKLELQKQLTRSSKENYTTSRLKTKRSRRSLPINDYVLELLKRERERQDNLIKKYGKEKFNNGFICVHTRKLALLGKPFAHNYYNESLTNILNILDISLIRFHDLRHSYGSNLIYQGVPITIISKLMGHKNPQITYTIYSHIIDSLDDAVYDKINQNILDNLIQTQTACEVLDKD